MCCCVRLHFLNLYPLVGKVSSWSTELQAVAKWITFRDKKLFSEFLISKVRLAEALHGCKVKQWFVFNAKSSASSSPHHKIVFVKEY